LRTRSDVSGGANPLTPPVLFAELDLDGYARATIR
jgi:hypothetical protein